jgi:hypothetical protein
MPTKAWQGEGQRVTTAQKGRGAKKAAKTRRRWGASEGKQEQAHTGCRERLGGEGVDERVSDQASAPVGATAGLYHIIRLHASRGARNEETFWKRSRSLEGAWKELKQRAGAQGRSSTLATGQAPWLDLKVGARLRTRRKPSCPPFDGRRDDKRRCCRRQDGRVIRVRE